MSLSVYRQLARHSSCRELGPRPFNTARTLQPRQWTESTLLKAGVEAAALAAARRSWRPASKLQAQQQQTDLAYEDEEEDVMEASSSSKDLDLDLPLPAQYHQKKLSMKEVKELRSASNTLAKEGTIQRMICGQKGITQNFLNACADALSKHTFLRIKLGEGAGMERGQAARALEQYLDAVAVHQVGFTVTLHRQQGLPRPSNCPEAPGHVAEPAHGSDSDGLSLAEAAVAVKPRVPHQRASAKSAERVKVARAAAKVAAKQQLKGPPEFSVL